MLIEEMYGDSKILFEHFPIDSSLKDQYPFYDLNVVKNNQINEICDLLNYDLIFIGHEHKSFCIKNKLYDVGTSGCCKDNITKYTILNTENMKINTKEVEYDRTSFEEEILKYEYPNRNLIAKRFFGIEI